MNNEYKLQIRAFLKLLCVCGFALLYALGGVEHKELRRYVAPLFLTGCMWLFNRNWKVFLQAPLLMFTLSLGYGADTLWEKIIRRLGYGAANGATSMAQWVSKRNSRDFWILFVFHVFLCIITCVVLGVLNPTGSARAEELVMGFIIGFLTIYMPKDKET